ncbi:MAG: hypothetical protein HQL49_04480 [Gammaproteobacteria bacterium]|nr:hypothetical protein [Gammaproteobacteria bacterium]
MFNSTDSIPPHRVITAVLPKGRAAALMRFLVQECGITGVDVHFARGVGKMTPMQYRGIGETSEREVVTAVVPEDRADEIFTKIYHAAEINRPHGGIIYMQKASAATLFALPDLAEELL